MLDELDCFGGKMVQSQHRDRSECMSEGFVGHVDVMEW